MARSLKKGPFIHYKLEKKVAENVAANKKSVIKTWSRASMISPDFVGKTIGVHNGKQMLSSFSVLVYFRMLTYPCVHSDT